MAFAEIWTIDPTPVRGAVVRGAAMPFDAGSAKHLNVFEDVVMDAFGRNGAEFWWIDWQQKGGSSVPGIEALFVLNHTRHLYSARKGDPGLTFSRYGGPGGQRYPVGFSGDSFITWESLAFQPYFTATAANIGYGWWRWSCWTEKLPHDTDADWGMCRSTTAGADSAGRLGAQ